MNTEIVFRNALEDIANVDHKCQWRVRRQIAKDALDVVNKYYEDRRKEIVKKSQKFADVVLPWIADRKQKGLLLITACEMEVGQLGRVISPDEHNGKILVRVKNGAVRYDGSKGDSIDTWSFAGGPEPHVNGPYVELIGIPGQHR